MSTATGASFGNPCAAADGRLTANGHHHKQAAGSVGCKARYEFQMPLHYPRYTKSEYERMPEWQVDRLLTEYGLPVAGDVHHKRNFAMGAFLWPDQL